MEKKQRPSLSNIIWLGDNSPLASHISAAFPVSTGTDRSLLQTIFAPDYLFKGSCKAIALEDTVSSCDQNMCSLNSGLLSRNAPH